MTEKENLDVGVREGGIGSSVVAVAASVREGVSDVVGEMVARLLEEIPTLRGDEVIGELLVASARENVLTGLDVLEHGVDLNDVMPPLAAAEYARRLAQRGVALEALLRAYRLGQLVFVEWFLSATGELGLDGPQTLAVVDRVLRVALAYTDRVSDQLMAIYLGERERWLRSASVLRAAHVRSVLAGDGAELDDVEAALGYRMRRWHVGVIAWLTSSLRPHESVPVLDRVASALAMWSAPMTPLIVIADGMSVWAWLPAHSAEPVAEDAMARAIQDCARHVRVALGAPGEGIEGFRATHRQALRAQTVARAQADPGSPVTSFATSSLLAFLAGDADAARAWVQSVLGPLARDGEPIEHLRTTVRVFLETNGSFAETAARLHLHRNTVHYRVRKAEELRGRPFTDDRMGVEVALLACQRLGANVLTPPGGAVP